MNAELTAALSAENGSESGAFEELQMLLMKQRSIMDGRTKNVRDLTAAEDALKSFDLTEAQPVVYATHLADITGTTPYSSGILRCTLLLFIFFIYNFRSPCNFLYLWRDFIHSVFLVQSGTLLAANYLLVPNATIQKALQEHSITIAEVNSLARKCMLKPFNIDDCVDAEMLRHNPRQR